MIGFVMAAGVETVMERHYYTIGGLIRRQTDGGCIGSDQTGEMSRVYMIDWDEIFRDKCKSAGIKLDMYGRYVDDETIVTREVNRGWRYNKSNGVMEFDWELWKLDEHKDGEARTAETLAAIANSIHPEIQVTTDFPGKNSNGRMAVLDLEIWTEEIDGVPQIVHSFYKKPVASRYTIMKRSAVSEKIKRDTIFQETIRRVLHVSSHLPWEETVRHLDIWANCLRISGYNQKECFDTIRGAIMRVKEMRRKVSDGEIPSLNRSKDEILRTKAAKGGHLVP